MASYSRAKSKTHGGVVIYPHLWMAWIGGVILLSGVISSVYLTAVTLLQPPEHCAGGACSFLYQHGTAPPTSEPIPCDNDGVCEGPREDQFNCGDCPSICGDGICAPHEVNNCCGAGQDCTLAITCGRDQICSACEDAASCPSDCREVTPSAPAVTITPSQPPATLTSTLRPRVGALDLDLVADPLDLTEPGGDVLFEITITNEGSQGSVKVNTLDHNSYGNVADITDSTCAVPQTIPFGGSYECEFTHAVNGSAGDSEIHTVSASGTDINFYNLNAEDTETLRIIGRNETPVPRPTATPEPPDESDPDGGGEGDSRLEVEVIPQPGTLPAPGGPATFLLRVTNLSDQQIVVTALNSALIAGLTDTQDTTCTVPQVIAAGGTYECTYSAGLAGNAGDIITETVLVLAEDADGNSLNGANEGKVEIVGEGSGETETGGLLPSSIARIFNSAALPIGAGVCVLAIIGALVVIIIRRRNQDDDDDDSDDDDPSTMMVGKVG